MPREVTDKEGTIWNCAQAYAGLNGDAQEKADAARVPNAEDLVYVVATPRGEAQTVPLQPAANWEQSRLPTKKYSAKSRKTGKIKKRISRRDAKNAKEQMFMLGGKSWDEWINEYSKSHEHPMNKLTHQIGIPMIALSILTLPLALFVSNFWMISLALFIFGWILQFVGHAFERKPPEFFRDWRFLLVGLRWWLKKIKG